MEIAGGGEWCCKRSRLVSCCCHGGRLENKSCLRCDEVFVVAAEDAGFVVASEWRALVVVLSLTLASVSNEVAATMAGFGMVAATKAGLLPR